MVFFFSANHRILSGGKSTLYRDNETARAIFKMLTAFEFIPEDNSNNNKVKGWHKAFARLVGGNHPTIFLFFASLQRGLSLRNVKIETIRLRTSQQNNRPVYNQINRKLIEFRERRDTISIIILLEDISYLLTN
ncbi:LOW QUALITY PROTEIN: hypothetical protein HZS_5199 [Henneguya salminicola]|nr:LOW QUALITY PROTEIN: hypothetical protein HZS_5199 [Henneguya salminicola]